MHRRILTVVDPVEGSPAAMREGVDLAVAHGAEVVFFAVLPRYAVPMAEFTMVPVVPTPSREEFERDASANARRVLAAATKFAERAGVRCRTAVGSGPRETQCILEVAQNRRCDLIVVSSAGDNALVRLISGSVIPGLITQSPVPVLVVREAEPASHEAPRPPKPRRRRSARVHSQATTA